MKTMITRAGGIRVLRLVMGLLVLFSVPAMWQIVGTAYDGNWAAIGKAPVRVLEFPSDVSVGQLAVLLPQYSCQDKHLHGEIMAECRGKVQVPVNAKLMLLANDMISDRYACLDKLPPNAIEALILSKTVFSDAAAAHVGRLTGLRYLDLEGTEISDKGIAQLAGLVHLGYLNVSRTLIHGSTISKLSGLRELEYFNISCTELDSKVFTDMGKLSFPVLQQLDLSRTLLRDSDMPNIASFKSVKKLLVMDNPALTDRCLPVIRSMPNLWALDARSTGITLKGVLLLKGMNLRGVSLSESQKNPVDEARFKAAMPNVQLGFDTRSRSLPKSLFDPLH